MAIACFLVENGADIEHRNNANRRPLDSIQDRAVSDIVRKHAKSAVILFFLLSFTECLPLDKVVASRALFDIVSGSDGRAETLMEPAK